MKNFLLLVILFTIGFQLWAENIERKINWKSNKNIVPGTESFSWPDFENSEKYNHNSIPYYIENLQIAVPASSFNLKNPTYTKLTNVPSEILHKLPEEIKFSYSIFKSGKEVYLQYKLNPFIKRENRAFRINSFEIEIEEEQLKEKSAQTTSSKWEENSVLSSGKWVQIKTNEQGIYKITYNDLQSWGFSNPESVNIYGNGGYMLPLMNENSFFDDLKQNVIWHGKDGTNNDCLFFYSTGTVKWSYNNSKKVFVHQGNYFSDDTYYYLTDKGSSLMIQPKTIPPGNTEKQVNEFDFYAFHEKDEANLINSGATWYGDKHLNGHSKAFAFDIPGRILTDTLQLYIESFGRSSEKSTLNIYINGQLTGLMEYNATAIDDPESIYGRPNNLFKKLIIPESSISISTRYTAANNNSEAWINYIEINSRCKLELNNSQLLFRDIRNVKENGLMEYVLNNADANTQIWDVSDYTQAKLIQTNLQGTNLKFVTETDQLHDFVAFNPSGDIPTPEKVKDIDPQNLHAAPVAEMLIISHPRFLDQANELADFHMQNDQITVAVYSTEKVYNEFSSGIADAAGVRNFIRMCYEKSSGENQLKYVLLLGDGSFDNKNIRDKGYNLVPTYQTTESLSPINSFISDDFFVLLDQNEGEHTGLVDLGIGRIPCRTVDEAEYVVEKIKNYVAPEALGKWRNVVCFIGDDGNSADRYTNQHMQQSETIANLINQNHPAFYTDKIYFDAYRRESTSGMATYPDVNIAINERVKEGVLILNYIGHANEESLADERVLDIPAIDSWSNYKNLPVFVTATCEFSRFDEDELSAGEHILFNPSGGGIGLFSTTRLVYSNANFNLTKSFYNHVFEKDAEGKNLRMGEIMRLAKIESNTGNNKRNFSLLTDPALRLAYPQLQVKTETINGQSVEKFTGTISALQKITITGVITDNTGSTDTDFNGTVIPIVYDKAIELETIGNAGQSTMMFSMQDNVIYKGNVSVSQGSFSFSFIVPKDISYSIDNGKIIYYAENESIDAHGAFENFMIGGSSGTTINDDQGPIINMYMNNESFRSGDKVGASPILIAKISDENGINTVGTGIGHDITAVLDGDNSKIYVLNDYYEADIDSYTSGTIVFPFNDLEPGKHSLSLKIWDVVNNSSEASIEFVVTSDFQIEEVKCHPNPVSSYTYFSIVHNLPDEMFSASIEIFDRTGQRIDLIEQQLPSDGTESIPVKWYPSESNSSLKAGLYLVRFTITSSQGKTTAKTGKFIFLKN